MKNTEAGFTIFHYGNSSFLLLGPVKTLSRTISEDQYYALDLNTGMFTTLNTTIIQKVDSFNIVTHGRRGIKNPWAKEPGLRVYLKDSKNKGLKLSKGISVEQIVKLCQERKRIRIK